MGGVAQRVKAEPITKAFKKLLFVTLKASQSLHSLASQKSVLRKTFDSLLCSSIHEWSFFFWGGGQQPSHGLPLVYSDSNLLKENQIRGFQDRPDCDTSRAKITAMPLLNKARKNKGGKGKTPTCKLPPTSSSVHPNSLTEMKNTSKCEILWHI